MGTLNMKNKLVNKVFDDLDAYRNFCRDFGYVFNEKDLYKRNTVWSQYERFKRGDRVVNNWEEDSRTMSN